MGEWPSRQIIEDDEQFIVTTADTRPATLGQPSTRWSIRKLADYLAVNRDRAVMVGVERVDRPKREAKLARIEHVMQNFPRRTFAFDEFVR